MKRLHWVIETSILFFLGVGTSLCASWFFVKHVQHSLTTLDIPVLIEAQDAQGGQFQLGVRRAMEWATAFGLDEVGVRKIRPRFIDENPKDSKPEELTKNVLDAIMKLNPPIVIGPLRST